MNTLKQTRLNRGLSQRQAAELIGIFPEALCAYETGNQRPHERMRNRIEDNLGLVDWEPEFKLHTIKDARLALHNLVKCVSGLLDDQEHSQMIDAIIEQVQILKLLRKPKPPVVYGQVFRSETKKLKRTKYNGDNTSKGDPKAFYVLK